MSSVVLAAGASAWPFAAHAALPVGSSRATMARVVRLRRLTAPAATDDPVVSALQHAAAGDQSAFGDVYDHLAAVVYGTVLKVLRDPAMSEEVTQEVFLELWRQAPRFDAERGSPKTWATTIAHRRAVDRVRSEQSARNREETEGRRTDRPVDEVADTVADRLDRAEVVTALEQLTEAQREAVMMAYYGGHTYQEVAALLGVPEGTIKTRIRDGLARLRTVMEVTR